MKVTPIIDLMGKTELRAACKDAGIKYGKMNNAAMREALKAHTTPAEAKKEEVEETAAEPTGVFAMLLGKTAPVLPQSNGYVTTVSEGKPANSKPAPSNPRSPAAPRVSCKGYTIQKDRPESGGIKRQSKGSIGDAIWAEFDRRGTVVAKDLAEIAANGGWNKTSVQCAFYNWRKFHGIKGRA